MDCNHWSCYSLSLSYATIIRNTNWHDEISLFSHDVKISDSYSIENSLGTAYFNQGEYSKALPYFMKSVAQRPYETNYQNIASTYLKMGDIQNAAKYYAMAMTANNYHLYDPQQHDSLTYVNYAQILVFHESPSKADKLLEEAVKDYPGIPILWELLAFTKVDLHDKQGALEAANNALQLDPTSSIQTFYNDCLDNKPFTLRAQLDTGLVSKTVTCR